MEEDSIDISPPHLLPIYSLTLVQQFLSSNQLSQAYEFYTHKIESKSDEDKKSLAENLISRSFIDLSLQMTKKALEDANGAIQIDQYAAPAYFVMGISHLWNGNEENALSIWRTGLDHTKELSYFTLMTSLVNSLNFRAHLYKMKFDVNHILDLVDDFANPRYTTESNIQDAFCELRNFSYESAIEHFTMILKVNPQNHYAYKGRGVAYIMIGNYKECIKDLTTAIEKTPNNFQIDTVKVRAIAYAATGNITSALFDLNKYLLFVQDDYEVKIEVAKLNMRRKTYSAAYKFFLSIPESEIMKNDDSILSFAECLYAVGELKNAKLILNRIEKLKNHKYHYISYLINRDLNQLEKAENDIVEAVKLVPTFFLNRTAADFFCDIGEVEKSIEYYKEALQQCPYDAETHLFYAHALFEVGKLGESALMLQELTVQNEKFKFRGSLDHFNKMNYGIDLLDIAQSDFCFIQTAIMSIDTSIMNLQHGFFQPQMTNFNHIFPNFIGEKKSNQISDEKTKQVDDKELAIVEDVTEEKTEEKQEKEETNPNKEKLTNNIQKIEELKNRLAKFYINTLNTNNEKEKSKDEDDSKSEENKKDNENENNNNENDNDNDNENDKDESDLNNQKLEKKIEREMLNYLFGKDYNNEIDKDEMNFNECLDQMIALNGNENENSSGNFTNLIPYLSKSYSNRQQPSSSTTTTTTNSNSSEINQTNNLFLKQINNDFKLSPLKMTAETIKMIKDADRLGQRCITQVHEKTVNKRLARALGFCVLRIAFMMKTQWFNTKSHHWFTAFDEIKTILQFADMRKQIKFNCVDLISKCNQKKAKIAVTFYHQLIT